MSKIKRIVRAAIGDKNWKHLSIAKRNYQKLNNSNNNISKVKAVMKTKLLKDYNRLFQSVHLEKSEDKYFYYSIDVFKELYYDNDIIGNLMVDYEKILKKSLQEYKEESSDIYKNCINAIESFIDREESIIENDKIKGNIDGIKSRSANSFQDALQRILFLNQLLWQTGHYLNGLGRLDKILIEYYEKDLKNSVIAYDEARQMVKEFLEILHRDYYYKSNSLAGDTGQIIILGGEDKDGSYLCNELTYMFIDVIKEMKEPDPKILLRVSKHTPRKLIEKSLDCIKTGIGCPLFANDDVIIPKLIEFGFDESDVFNYGTAACWEPFITGKSFDQNNIKSISFMNPWQKMLENEDLSKFNSIEEVINCYYNYLEKYLDEFKTEVDKIKFSKDPLLSICTDNCLKNNKDIADGGAKYNNYGFTGVGISNLVNSILMVDEYVFKRKKYRLEEFYNIIKENYEGQDNFLKEIKENKNKYGKDEENVLKMSNEIIKKVSLFFENKRNPLGGKYKFGLSAPSYIEESKNFPASFDGRKYGEPFGVHISCDVLNGYTELVQFAAKLDYGEDRFNGNVIDFFVSPNFIEDNFEKFVDFLMASIKIGFFEMQMNVISSEKLLEARKNPEKFPNLIVRVWGFSAYFNDLPEEYKEYIIERALRSEGKIV